MRLPCVNSPAPSRDLHVIAARCRVSGSSHQRCQHPDAARRNPDDNRCDVRRGDWREIRVILAASWRILP
jgi:hypothetical protein